MTNNKQFSVKSGAYAAYLIKVRFCLWALEQHFELITNGHMRKI